MQGSTLSRCHSILYSGVFEERVFRVFNAGGKSSGDAEVLEESRLRWGLQYVDGFKGVNDRITVGEDWGVVRTAILPGGKDNVFEADYRLKYTEEGAELESSF